MVVALCEPQSLAVVTVSADYPCNSGPRLAISVCKVSAIGRKPVARSIGIFLVQLLG